jgi:CheY-like chemotaxis protein
MVVLAIDDDSDDLDLLCEAIKEIEPEALFIPTNSAESALRFLSGYLLPDIIFLDINMPVIDGRACLHKIKSIPSLAFTDIIMYSTSNASKDLDECKSLGAEFLVKPNSYSQLVTSLRPILQRH